MDLFLILSAITLSTSIATTIIAIFSHIKLVATLTLDAVSSESYAGILVVSMQYTVISSVGWGVFYVMTHMAK